MFDVTLHYTCTIFIFCFFEASANCWICTLIALYILIAFAMAFKRIRYCSVTWLKACTMSYTLCDCAQFNYSILAYPRLAIRFYSSLCTMRDSRPRRSFWGVGKGMRESCVVSFAPRLSHNMILRMCSISKFVYVLQIQGRKWSRTLQSLETFYLYT